MDDDDDDFEEYNPHPYGGGYDIALTYGPPLPPSSATCYPLSDALHAAVDAPPTEDRNLPPLDHRDPPPPVQQNPPPPVEQNPPPPAEQNPPPPDDYSSDSFPPWPPLTTLDEERCRWRDQTYEPCYWNQWRRAADYLFGYSHGYGERRIGIDSYGIPIYANKRVADVPLVGQIEPPRSHRLDFYDGSGHEQVHHPNILYEAGRTSDDIHVQQDPMEQPRWYQNNSHNEVYREQLHRQPEWSSPYDNETVDEFHFSGTPNYAYDKHYCEEPLHVQVETIEPNSFQKPRYYDVYQQEHAYHETNWSSSYDNETLDEFHFSGTLNYAYDKHYYEEPLHVQVETIEPNSFQKPRYFHVYQQEHASHETKWHSSSYGEPPEPFEPTWSRERSSYGIYDEEPSSDSKLSFSSHDKLEEWSDVYGNPSYDYERNYHEQPLSDQLEPFKPTWSQNPILYGLENEEMFPKFYSGNESNEEITSQFFFPLNKYPEY